jgi:sulfotransferase
MNQISYLAGFPRSGSTLLCNLLAMHPNIAATASSPLCNIVQNMRRQWSDDPFLLAQLDQNFEQVHNRLTRSTRSFMETFSDYGKNITVDKNRGWIFNVETLRHLDPDFKMIICLRDLRDIYASVERRHRRSLMIEFPDHMEHNHVDGRASALLEQSGIIGNIWQGIYNLGDIPDIMEHCYFWKYEDFLKNPQETMDDLFEWLGEESHEIDFDNIVQSTFESDSWYRMKYPHSIKSKFGYPATISDREIAEKAGIPLTEDNVSPRILGRVVHEFKDFYIRYYSNEEFIEDYDPEFSAEIGSFASELDAKIQEEIKRD